MASFEIKDGVGIFSEGTTKVGKVAFFGFTSLTGIIIPNTVKEIDDCAFENCTALKFVTLGNSVKRIGHSAFLGCINLMSITIPDSVTEIGGFAFYGCRALINVTIPNSVIKIGKWAFMGCSSLTSIALPDSINTMELDGAFAHCHSLTSFTLPKSITRIGDEMFACCSSLTSINIPNSVRIIGAKSFSSCRSLHDITIPNSVFKIEYGAFSYCTGLTKVTIPDSVYLIDHNAFNECEKLAVITIPKGCRQKFLRILPSEYGDKLVEVSENQIQEQDQSELDNESKIQYLGCKEQPDIHGFQQIIDVILDMCIEQAVNGKLDKDELKDFIAKAYLAAPGIFIESAVKKIEPKFDFWEKVYQRLSSDVEPYEFYLHLLLSYHKSDGHWPNDKRWYRPLKNMFDNEIRARSILSLMNKAFCESNDESFKYYIAFLVLECCEYDLGIIERFSNPTDGGDPAVSSVFFDAIQTEMDYIIDDADDRF